MDNEICVSIVKVEPSEIVDEVVNIKREDNVTESETVVECEIDLKRELFDPSWMEKCIRQHDTKVCKEELWDSLDVPEHSHKDWYKYADSTQTLGSPAVKASTTDNNQGHKTTESEDTSRNASLKLNRSNKSNRNKNNNKGYNKTQSKTYLLRNKLKTVLNSLVKKQSSNEDENPNEASKDESGIIDDDVRPLNISGECNKFIEKSRLITVLENNLHRSTSTRVTNRLLKRNGEILRTKDESSIIANVLKGETSKLNNKSQSKAVLNNDLHITKSTTALNRLAKRKRNANNSNNGNKIQAKGGFDAIPDHLKSEDLNDEFHKLNDKKQLETVMENDVHRTKSLTATNTLLERKRNTNESEHRDKMPCETAVDESGIADDDENDKNQPKIIEDDLYRTKPRRVTNRLLKRNRNEIPNDKIAKVGFVAIADEKSINESVESGDSSKNTIRVIHNHETTDKSKAESSTMVNKSNNMIQVMHNDETIDKSDAESTSAIDSEKLYPCSHCAFVTKYKSNLIVHLKQHIVEKTFLCNLCSYKCGYKSSLVVHMRTHTGEKPFSCSVCDYECAVKTHLVRHMRTHTGERPFSCSLCEHRSADRTQLVRHMRTHTGEKPFACTECSYRFAEKGGLIRHMRTHTGEKPFPCTLCDYRGGLKKNLIAHMMTHTGEKPFSCSLCSYRCGQKFQLVRHMKTHVKTR